MNGKLTEDTKAILLLCAHLGMESAAKPLTQVEYSKLVRWLVSVGKRPVDLLDSGIVENAGAGAFLDVNRLKALLGRGVQLGFAVEEWHRNGIWVISRSDAEYPKRYKNHLKEQAPPLLFGVGNKTLLTGGGLAIVGSRNVDSQGEEFTVRVAQNCIQNRMTVVSGGARGVDQIAMRTALDDNGVVIGVVAEDLLKKSIERNFRQALATDHLLLVSPYHPKATFSVGNAMARNKMIYAFADYGLVVSADYQKGGTWAGAEEELHREKPLPVFVRIENDCPLGNKKLLERGAVPWPAVTSKNLKEILEQSRPKNDLGFQEGALLNLFDAHNVPDDTVSKIAFVNESEPDVK